MSVSLAGLIQRLSRDRDPDAWAQLLQASGGDILRVCRAILKDAGRAEDAAQETLLKIRDHAGMFVARPGADPDIQAQAWIRRVACNAALQSLRAHRRMTLREDAHAQQHSDIDTSSVDAARIDETMEAVEAEMERLPEEHRVAIALRYFGGLELADVAAELRWPVGTVKARIHRGLERLRERLALLGLLLPGMKIETLMSQVSSTKAVLASQHAAAWQTVLSRPQSAGPLFSAPVRGGLSFMAKAGITTAALAAGFMLVAVGPVLSQEPTAAPVVRTVATPPAPVVAVPAGQLPAPPAASGIHVTDHGIVMDIKGPDGTWDVQQNDGKRFRITRKDNQISKADLAAVELSADSVQMKLNQKMDLDLNDVLLVDAVQTIGRQAGVPVTINDPANKGAQKRVTFKRAGISGHEALDAIVQGPDLTYGIAEPNVVFSILPGGDDAATASDDAELVRALQRKVSFEFVDTPLEEGAAFIRSVSNRSLIMPEALLKGGPVVSMRVNDMDLGVACRWMLRLAKLDYHTEKGGVVADEGVEPSALKQKLSCMKLAVTGRNGDDVLKALSAAQLPLQIEPEAVSAAHGVAVTNAEGTAYDLLAQVIKAANLNWRLASRKVVVEGPEVPEWKSNIIQKLRRKVTFNFVDSKMDTEFSFLMSVASVNIIAAPDAGLASIKNSWEVKQDALIDVLDKFITSQGLEVQMVDQALYIQKAGASLFPPRSLREEAALAGATAKAATPPKPANDF